MSKVAIVTDTNSGITQDEASRLGAFLIPMPIIVDDKTYYESIDMDRKKFYKSLSEDAHITTAQPLPLDIIKTWNDVLKEYDSLVYIPMSSSLSRSYETAVMLSREFNDRVYVVNNKRISATQRQSVIDALELSEAGISAQDIRVALEKDTFNSTIYITVNTLKYLKKGGRITPAVAAIGTILKIKPVLQIQGGLLDTFAKVRTTNGAKKIMLNALKDDISNRFTLSNEEDEIMLMIAHTNEDMEAEILRKELFNIYPGYSIYVGHLPLSIACHLGPGALGVGCAKKLKIESRIVRKI